MRVTQILGLIVLTGLVSLTPAAGQNAAPTYVEPANLTELIAAANKEGTLNLGVGNTYGGAHGAQVIQDHLNAQYHTNIAIHYTLVSGGVQYVSQLMQEVRAGQPASSDIMFSVFTVAQKPFTEAVNWRKYVPGLPADAMVYEQHAVKVLAALSAFSYNTKLVAPNQVPRSYYDLLKPEWKGKIATSPYQGTFLNFLGLPNVFGHQGMLDYVKKFSAQVGGIFVCGETDRVVSGEFALYGIDCGDHETRLRERKGEPIAEFYPKEGVPLNYISPAIPLTTQHPNAARLLIVYLLSRQGQQDMWDMVGEDSDLMPGSHMAQVLTQLRKQGVKVLPGVQGTGIDETHPELLGYQREIDGLINQGK